ncbi:MAG: peptidoglycan DD-metalloendopeptidase family protein [Oscillospiraceae bacterium]|nr:peptidoglycan DD-metalloendopeptidase family protein [Oscillospiraceae bacterium]MBR7010248.1 peptidoglycan DD-metalloendopeptidase family protein [Oscillospiraceae bacterium]
MYKYRRVIVGAVAALLALLMVGGVVLSAFAESSSTIKARIEALKQQEAAIAAQQQEVKAQRVENENDINDLVEQKNAIDQQIKLTQDSIENKNEQIREYNLLIAEKQNELDDAFELRDQLNERYKIRIRSMEEKGKLTYWSILFKASSFADLLDRVDMINEIARSDSNMISKIQSVAQQIETTRQELAAEKVGMEEAKESLAADEAALETQRQEADELMTKLMADHDAYVAKEAEYSDQKEALLAQIATQESKYKEAVAAEEKARREAEAAERARKAAAAAAAAQRQSNASGGGSSSSSSGSSSSGGSSSSSGGGSSSGFAVSRYGFQWPCTARYITCEFGPRYHPITGVYSNHSGMDIGAGYGAPIYACASGTVTTATFGTAYGYHVVINHGNGFSTLYGHMIRYTVKVGEYVTRGEVIGYVGSTGWSTGPHLHLTMYYNGSLVNPKKYLP